MFAILDKQTGKRYGQAHFINEVVDFIRSDKGRAPCYELIEGDVQGVPSYLRGRTYSRAPHRESA
jgi:hypothetical protein